jgi:signal transduction histidine kinase
VGVQPARAQLKPLKSAEEIASVAAIRNTVLNSALVTIAVVAFPGLLASLARSIDIGWQDIMYVHIVAYITVACAASLRHRLSFNMRVYILFGMLFFTGAVSIYSWGLLGNIAFMLIVVVLATVMFGTRTGMYSLGGVLAFITLIFLAVEQDIITYDSLDYYDYGTSASTWVSRIVSMGFFGAIMVAAAGQLYGALIEKVQNLEAANRQLKHEIKDRILAQHELEHYKTQLESRVKERTTQLQLKNDELEAFTYSVSHDLRTPLRAMHGFSKALMQEFHHDLPEQAQHYLSRIQANAGRMSELIDSLLHLSRIGRSDMRIRDINPTGTVHEIIEALFSADDFTHITFAVDPLPACQADALLMRQVWVNLIDNAVKYTTRVSNPVIHIGHELGDNQQTVYYVRDNGVGFDMAYADKLFRVFQRLHSQSEYDGAGVGLAIVKRIIERHEGRVWANAEVGKGATFYFSFSS